jgi:hypothetical protein
MAPKIINKEQDMLKSAVDRLMDMCDRHAAQMAEEWHKSLVTNSRTPTCKSMSKDGSMRHAIALYKNMGQMYFGDDCYKSVEDILDTDGFVEDFYARNIPLEEVLYALVLLRRHIWLYADREAVFRTDNLFDLNAAVESINRILLVFDYASYIAAHRYREIARK